jgi:hypothetical protein
MALPTGPVRAAGWVVWLASTSASAAWGQRWGSPGEGRDGQWAHMWAAAWATAMAAGKA